MSIEDYWFDGLFYYVEFIAMDGRTIGLELVVPVGFSENMINNIVMKSFKNIRKITYIELINETLVLKSTFI